MTSLLNNFSHCVSHKALFCTFIKLSDFAFFIMPNKSNLVAAFQYLCTYFNAVGLETEIKSCSATILKFNFRGPSLTRKHWPVNQMLERAVDLLSIVNDVSVGLWLRVPARASWRSWYESRCVAAPLAAMHAWLHTSARTNTRTTKRCKSSNLPLNSSGCVSEEKTRFLLRLHQQISWVLMYLVLTDFKKA